jgi:putative Mg2+ transporter-C (MgtC) family protein
VPAILHLDPLALHLAAAQPEWLRELAAGLRLDLLAKLIMAVFLGGMVGLEREMSGKPAGLRTNILICLGSAILMDLSIRIGVETDGTRVGDPARLAAQVVTGVGFLGAGTILQARGVIVGLTTAATIWVVAAIGLTIGAGAYIEAVGATILVTGVLVGLARVERFLNSMRRVVTLTVRATLDVSFEEVSELFAAYGITVQSKEVSDTMHERTFELRLLGPARQFEVVAGELMRRPDVLNVQFD